MADQQRTAFPYLILDQRWDGFQDWAQSALVVPNYTRLGFELRDTPASVHEKLQEQLVKGLARARWETYGANVKPLLWPQPKFIDLGRVWQDVLHELQPLHEEWGGVKLVPIVAYGLRIYQNGSTLLMHHDKARRVAAVWPPCDWCVAAVWPSWPPRGRRVTTAWFSR